MTGSGLRWEGRPDLAIKLHGVPWCPMFSGFLVILLVEAPYQFLEDRPHAMVIQARMPDRIHRCSLRGSGLRIDLGRGELLNQGADRRRHVR